MLTKSAEIQNRLNELDGLIQGEASDVQKTIWENERNGLRDQLQAALSEEASQQERVEAQEAEIQAITLPYDFEELYGEEGRPVKNLNAMIIEVVKDTKRQANIEKNKALDEQKAEYQSMLLSASDREKQLQEEINIVQTNHLEDIRLREESDRKLGQAILERDDAFNKRDAAFRQLEEANETIRGLKTKLENVPVATQSFDISPSDKLAQMVKESLDEKVARGLDRWKDIIPVQTPTIPPVNEDTRQDEAATETPFQDQATEAADTERDTSLAGNIPMDESLGSNESEVNEQELYYAMPATMGDIAKIKEQINHLNNRLDNTAVRLDVIEGHKAVA